MPLSEKQKRFCQEYIIDLNATKAAIRAGYSENGAKVQGHRLLTNANIKSYIVELIKNISQKTEITAERVLKEYAKLAFTNFDDLVDMSTGRPVFRDIEAINPDHMAALQSVSETKVGLKFRMHDKKGALDALARHLGIFAEDNKRELEMKIGKITEEDADFVRKIFADIEG